MTDTFKILSKKLSGKRNPNGFTISWSGETLPTGTTWSTGYQSFEIIPMDWGFQVIKDNGKIAPPTQVNFGKYFTESDFYGAFDRAIAFVKNNSVVSEAVPAYVWGD